MEVTLDSAHPVIDMAAWLGYYPFRYIRNSDAGHYEVKKMQLAHRTGDRFGIQRDFLRKRNRQVQGYGGMFPEAIPRLISGPSSGRDSFLVLRRSSAAARAAPDAQLSRLSPVRSVGRTHHADGERKMIVQVLRGSRMSVGTTC